MLLPLAALLLGPPQDNGHILIVEPSVPSSLETALVGRCDGREVTVRYGINRPGRDMFAAISVDGRALPDSELRRLNAVIGEDDIEYVNLVACDDMGEGYEAHVRLAYGPEERRRQHLLGIGNGRFRIIR
jgi:hypothetical protein